MDTKSYRAAAAAVTGARHLRAGRNGQDAATTLVEGDVAVAVVCDGCSAGTSSEVGARLGARLFARAVANRLGAGASATDPAMWAAARVELATTLRLLATDGAEVAAMVDGAMTGRAVVRETRASGVDLAAVHDLFLFTIVAAAMTRESAAVWALGDGAYVIDGEARVLGPFANNEPPYVAYDLVGETRPAHLDARGPEVRTIVVATDGAVELADAIDGDLAALAAPRFLAHGDALRRQLFVLARGEERIDWDVRRVVRVPAALQDDCAVAVLQRTGELA